MMFLPKDNFQSPRQVKLADLIELGVPGMTVRDLMVEFEADHDDDLWFSPAWRDDRARGRE